MNYSLRRYTTGTDSERGHGRILKIEEISSPKVSALVLSPWCVDSCLAAKLFVQDGGFWIILVTAQGLPLAF